MAEPQPETLHELYERISSLEKEIRGLYERIASLEHDNGALREWVGTLRQWVSKLEGDIVVFTRANESLHSHWREEMLKGSPLRGALKDALDGLSVEGDERPAEFEGQ
jgi:hypothetical protein